MNTPVSISVKITSTGTITGPLAILVVQDYGWPVLFIYQWNNLTLTLNGGVNNVNVGSFTPGDLTNPLPGLVHQYFIDAYWNNILIYNPVFKSGQETVRTVSSDFTQYAFSATVTMTVGSSTTSTITARSRNNFAGTVTFSNHRSHCTCPFKRFGLSRRIKHVNSHDQCWFRGRRLYDGCHRDKRDSSPICNVFYQCRRLFTKEYAGYHQHPAGCLWNINNHTQLVERVLWNRLAYNIRPLRHQSLTEYDKHFLGSEPKSGSFSHSERGLVS